MRIEISIDDAHKQDLRVAGMIEAVGMRGMFYVPAMVDARGHRGQAGLGDSAIRDLASRHEIGFHTFSHPHDMKLLNDKDVWDQVTRGRQFMEDLIGKKITSFCYPRGRYDARAVKAVMASGYVEARTVDVGHVKADYDPYRKPTTVHIHPRRQEYGGEHWVDYARAKLAEALAKPDGYFHLWGHGWEIEKFDLWSELEEVLPFLAPEYARIHASR